jgi:hypothetical protein
MINLSVISQNNKTISIQEIGNQSNYVFSSGVNVPLDYTNYFVNIKTNLSEVQLTSLFSSASNISTDYTFFIVLACVFFSLLLLIKLVKKS